MLNYSLYSRIWNFITNKFSLTFPRFELSTNVFERIIRKIAYYVIVDVYYRRRGFYNYNLVTRQDSSDSKSSAKRIFPFRIRTRKLSSYTEGKDIIRLVRLEGIGPGAWYVVRKIYIVFLRLGRKNRVPVSVYLIYGVSRGGSRDVARAYGVRIRQIKSGADRSRSSILIICSCFHAKNWNQIRKILQFAKTYLYT